MLAAVFMPMCWDLILYVLRKVRTVPALNVGLLNELERHSWVGGPVLALALPGVVSGLLG
jgi:hypothetical protein